jgi:hypothetical protein
VVFYRFVELSLLENQFSLLMDRLNVRNILKGEAQARRKQLQVLYEQKIGKKLCFIYSSHVHSVRNDGGISTSTGALI